ADATSTTAQHETEQRSERQARKTGVARGRADDRAGATVRPRLHLRAVSAGPRPGRRLYHRSTATTLADLRQRRLTAGHHAFDAIDELDGAVVRHFHLVKVRRDLDQLGVEADHVVEPAAQITGVVHEKAEGWRGR